MTADNMDKVAALRNELDAKRAAAIQKYLATQPRAGRSTYEVFVHDAADAGHLRRPFATAAFRGQTSGYRGGLSGGSVGNGSVGGGSGGGLPTGSTDGSTGGTGASTGTGVRVRRPLRGDVLACQAAILSRPEHRNRAVEVQSRLPPDSGLSLFRKSNILRPGYSLR